MPTTDPTSGLNAPPAADPWVPGRRSGAGPVADSPPLVGDGVREDWFAGIDLRRLTDAALQAAADRGAEHAEVRITNSRSAFAMARDDAAMGQHSSQDRGLSVRVLLGGCWGFAAGDELSPGAAAAVARRAVAMARVGASLSARRFALAAEPVHTGWWASPMASDPFDVPAADRLDLLVQRSAALHAAPGVLHSSAESLLVRERVHYADSAGAFLQQQRVRVFGEWRATAEHAGVMESLRSLAPPVARGWEYLLGECNPVGASPGWDFDQEIAEMPELLAEKVRAPGIEPSRYDLVLDPTHLMLTIHESVGHATEFDRSLGYEANYAGTTFASPEGRGTLSYGSPLMHVTGDRLTPHGLASAAFDDEGVAAQRWDIVRDGTLVDFQYDRAMAAELGRDRSTGCAYADSFAHVPIQRMPNVSLQHGTTDLSLDDIIGGVDDGLLILGDNSWSIDMQRYNFQFTGQRTYRIRNGRCVGQVRNAAYQSSTPEFWHSLSALGGPRTAMLGGVVNCGKGQPGQAAPVTHGCPVARFDGISVLNTEREGGR